MQAADSYLEKSRQMDRRKQELLYYYNHLIQDGKWEGILTPESFSPPPTVLYPAAKPALVIGAASLGVIREDNFIFHSHGGIEKIITLLIKDAERLAIRRQSRNGWRSVKQKAVLRQKKY